MSGGFNMRLQSLSQLKPSNHLKKKGRASSLLQMKNTFSSTGLCICWQYDKSALLVLLNVLGPISLTAQPLQGIAPWWWKVNKNTFGKKKSWITDKKKLFGKGHKQQYKHFLFQQPWMVLLRNVGFFIAKLSKMDRKLNWAFITLFALCMCKCVLEYLHSFFMRLEALLLMVWGKSICSMPPMAALRLFSGSELLKGSLRRSRWSSSLESSSGHAK